MSSLNDDGFRAACRACVVKSCKREIQSYAHDERALT